MDKIAFDYSTSLILERRFPPFPTFQYREYKTTAVKMSSFQIPDSKVDVTLCEGIAKDELLAFPAFKVYINSSSLPLITIFANPIFLRSHGIIV